jgi:hypothetical protein
MRRVKPFRLERRAVLRAAGISLALPWLEAMVPAPAYAKGAAAAAPRVLFLYFPTGYRKGDWIANKAAGTYPDFTLPAIAQALNPLKSKLTVITGLANKTATVGNGGDGIHARGTGCWLNCEVLNTTGFATGISADQVIAKASGATTCIPSLALGVPGEQVATFAEDGYGAVYYNNVSFTGPKANVHKENKPLDLYNRLITCSGFGTGPGTDGGTAPPVVSQRTQFEKSAMAGVKVEANRLMNCVGQDDRLRLQQYFDSISELERRFTTPPVLDGGAPPTTSLCQKPAAPGANGTFQQNAQTMMDLLILAFKCGLTNVATLMLDGAFSRRDYGLPDIDNVNYIHGLSHGEIGGKTVDHPRWVKITTHYFTLIAYLLQQMDAVNEGGATLLDNTIVYIGSEFGDGDAHSQSQHPLIIAGSGAGRLNTNRHIAVPNDTPVANALLTLMQTLGVQRTAFGDSNGTIPGLAI